MGFPFEVFFEAARFGTARKEGPSTKDEPMSSADFSRPSRSLQRVTLGCVLSGTSVANYWICQTKQKVTGVEGGPHFDSTNHLQTT